MRVASIVVNAAIAVLTLYAWLSLAMGWGTDAGRLSARGVASLKYFTVLSNLLSAGVSLACVFFLVQVGFLPLWLLALRLVAASAVSLTLLTVVVLLGPSYGWKMMFSGGNLWLHLVLPLLAVVDCVFLCPVGMVPVWATVLAMLPTALYAVWYVHRVRLHGREENGVLYDFYGFLRWGDDKIFIVAVVMLLITWGIALALWLASGLLCLA